MRNNQGRVSPSAPRFEVVKAGEALETKTYVACVTYVAMTLLSKGLSPGQPDRFILPNMAVAVLPNTSNLLSSAPLNPTPEPKYQLETEDGLLEDYCWEDDERKQALQEEHHPLSVDDGATGDHPDELEASVVTLPLPSEYDDHSRSASVVEGPLRTAASWFSKVYKLFCGLIKKVLYCVFDDDVKDFSDDPICGLSLFGAFPPDTMLVIEVLDDLESIKQIDDPWDFFRELDALKRYTDYYLSLKWIRWLSAFCRI
ncbi:hypothetical protein DFS33DRAFT_1272179 [Desarmillaria ectypa]|nr:hypothetical protein DFS33DRAFT_1272179 [Desarmillaria ectypa]